MTPGGPRIGDNWCPSCQGEGRVVMSRYGAGGPDTWLGPECDECGGSAERRLYTPSKRRWRPRTGSLPRHGLGHAALSLSSAGVLRRAGLQGNHVRRVLWFGLLSQAKGARAECAAQLP